MNDILLALDNPIVLKHSRSRLRPMHLLPSIAVVMILALSIVLLGYQYNGLRGGETFGALMMLQAVILGVMGASQISASMAKTRELGILDFHRVSPMPAYSLALGFFFGAPIREYLMFAATLPFSIACVFMGTPSILGFFQLLIPLVLGAWVFHSLALFNSLVGKGKKSGSGVRGVIGLVVFLLFGSSWYIPGFIGAARSVDEFPTDTFFTINLPWLLLLAIYLFPVIGFFLLASTRKFASERAQALSKPQAIACLTIAATLTLGGLWGKGVFPTLPVLYGLIGGAIVMILAITPGQDEFSKGIRKANKEGRRFPSPWSDRGLNRTGVFCLCGVVLIATTICWNMIEQPITERTQPRPPEYSLPIAIGVLVVAYFGLALQFFKIRFGKRGTTFFALFLFTTWLIPLVCGAINAASNAQRRTPDSPPDIWSAAIASLSPIIGIVFSSGVTETSGLREARACALIPALVFALLFNNLVTSARRRIEKEVHPETPEPAKFEIDEMSEPVMQG